MKLGQLSPDSSTAPRRAAAKVAVTLFHRPRTRRQWRVQYAVAIRLASVSEWAAHRATEWIYQLEEIQHG